ncbi:leukocyte receptor cluster member 9 [Ornithorhynchus anatinus]|uniref:Leukocyte receptor cluster member 9 n=1 Tax=Ornithorhynchus anatinus TaxID=9258 RepID=A0A6I8NJV3_ORNAN|nr:leukocyte receptor cluster member 9 [Ornithorhynchus anatinus]
MEDPAPVPVAVPAPCRFFLEGRCRFGARCRQPHPGAPGTPDRPPAPEPEPGSKKPPMKTAAAVIHRIRWDPLLDPADFSVGYLDRFLGVVEEPFDAFCWDEELGALGPGVLAVPQHRIRYFRHRGALVWDRHARIDHVFGSAGAGRTIRDRHREPDGEQDLQQEQELEQDLKLELKQELEQDLKQKLEREQDLKQELEHDLKLEQDLEQKLELEQDLKLELEQEATQEREEAARKRGGCGADGERGASLEVLPPGPGPGQAQGSEPRRSPAAAAGGRRPEPELDWGLAQQAAENHLRLGPGSWPGEEERAVELPRSARPPRPTHFVALPVTDPRLRASVAEVQDHLVGQDPDVAAGLVPPAGLHLTLCLLRLAGPREVAEATAALKQLARDPGVRYPQRLRLGGLARFGSGVLYATPSPDLGDLAQALAHGLESRGLRVVQAPAAPHLTLAKLPRGSGGSLPAPEPGGRELGHQEVRHLQLCRVGGPRGEEGGYETVAQVSLR